MTYNNLGLNSHHGKVHAFVGEQNCVIGAPPWIVFCRTTNLSIPESKSKQHYRMLWDLTRVHHLSLLEALTISGYL